MENINLGKEFQDELDSYKILYENFYKRCVTSEDLIEIIDSIMIKLHGKTLNKLGWQVKISEDIDIDKKLITFYAI